MRQTEYFEKPIICRESGVHMIREHPSGPKLIVHFQSRICKEKIRTDICVLFL